MISERDRCDPGWNVVGAFTLIRAGGSIVRTKNRPIRSWVKGPSP